MGRDPEKFLDYCNKRIETLKPTIAYTSFVNYKVNISKFEKFVQNKNLCFEDTTVSLFKDYEYHLLTVLGNGQTTTQYAFTIIKLMFNNAIEEELIDASIYPFRKFKIKKGKSTKSYLTEK